MGAGLAVPTVRHTSEALVNTVNPKESCLIRINPREPSVRRAQDVSLPLNGLEALEMIDEVLEL